MALLMLMPLGGATFPPDTETASVIAAIRRLQAALDQLEHVDIGLRHQRNRHTVRRQNPLLGVLGNPQDLTRATWAKIEYMRPDDPDDDGNGVIREHEFRDGFEIKWLKGGSVQLSHPRHPLWTEDDT
jgi:hypothetical protein